MNDSIFNKWVNFFSNHMQVGVLVIDRELYDPSEITEMFSAIGLVRTLMGHMYDWATENELTTIRRLK